MVINTNVEAQQTANHLNTSQLQLARSLARLSSGSKIIVPSDDAAGLAVSSRLNSQIKRLDSALNNVVNAVSFTQTQDGFMKTIDKAFRRMGELAMLAQDTTKSDEDRALYNQEFEQLKSYVGETAKQDFNGVSLFAGKELDVTVDSDGTTFTMVGIDLTGNVYNTAINSGTDAWKLTKNAWRVSKDGFITSVQSWNTSKDLWRKTDGTWTSTNQDADNTYTKYAAGSFVKESAANTADGSATNYAAGAFYTAKTTVVGTGSVQTDDWAGRKEDEFVEVDPTSTGTNQDSLASKHLSGAVVVVKASAQDLAAAGMATALGDDYDNVNLKSVVGSQVALSLLQSAITQVATDRAKLGAIQSRLNFTNDQLTVTKENLSAAISRISDVDVAEEATQYARYQILVASGTEMLKQANQLPQSALQLLK